MMFNVILLLVWIALTVWIVFLGSTEGWAVRRIILLIIGLCGAAGRIEAIYRTKLADVRSANDSSRV
jgi:hypothetical protein